MRTIIIAAVSALFFAALVTELSQRLWPGSSIALLVVTAIALFLSGLLNLRLAGTKGQTPAPAKPEAQAHRGSGGRGEQGRGRERRPATDDSRKGSRGTRSSGDRASARPAEPAAGPREQGTVKWFNRTKGFGFIIRESGDEIFVHQRSIRFTGEGDDRRRPILEDGQNVSFVVAIREKGPQAEDVVPADHSS